ncbi:MAG: hypothetical protein KF852_02340 [Saprospiraceae bacterium]|nr:hypothetical protein [Saprospiraceae bacterium]
MKKYGFFLSLCAIVIAAVTFSLSSCKRASEKTAEALIEKATGHKASIDKDGKSVTFETDEGKVTYKAGEKTLPDNFPKEAPAFPKNKITNSTYGETPEGQFWVIYYEGVNAEVLDKYLADLKDAGYKTSFFKMDEGGTVSGEKDNFIISCMIGNGQAVHSVHQKVSK